MAVGGLTKQMDATAEIGRNSELTRDGRAGPASRDQILRHDRGQGDISFPCLADQHEQDWQPYPVDPYSAIITCFCRDLDPCWSE